MSTVIELLIAAAMAISALVMHELAHVLATNYLGGRVEKIGILPLGFAARLQGLEKLLAWERYVIYVAGSTANVIIAAWTFSVSRMSYFGIPWLEQLALFNLVICIFNLLPVLPLDGGRVLHQFLANRIGIMRANRVMLRMGTCICWVLILLGFVQVILHGYNITLLCAAMYLRSQNKTMKLSLQMELFKFLNAKKAPARGRLMPVRTVNIPAAASIKYALERLTIDHFTEFRFNGHVLSEMVLLQHIFSDGISGTVASLEDSALPRFIESKV